MEMNWADIMCRGMLQEMEMNFVLFITDDWGTVGKMKRCRVSLSELIVGPVECRNTYGSR